MWQRSFVATSVALGTPVDEAAAAAAQDDELVGALRSSSRATRAAALATAVHEVVVALDAVTLDRP